MSVDQAWELLAVADVALADRADWLENLKRASGAAHWRQRDLLASPAFPVQCTECIPDDDASAALRLTTEEAVGKVSVWVPAGSSHADRWAKAMGVAAQELRAQTAAKPAATWRATIGPTAKSVAGRLSGEFAMGAVTLRPAAHPTLDAVPHVAGCLSIESSVGVHSNWLVSAEAAVGETTWGQMEHAAGESVFRTCALLSMLHGMRTWIPRSSPSVFPIDIPTASVLAQHFGIEDPGYGPAPEVESGTVAPWLNEAWTACERFSNHRLVSLFYEGCRLEEDHPSFSVVAYVTVIEALGKLLHGLEGRAAFETVLMTVLDAELADFVAQRSYSRRSAVVHGGHLFGQESSLSIAESGFFNTGRWAKAPRVAFRLRLLARHLLGPHLSSEWPTAADPWPDTTVLGDLLREMEDPPQIVDSAELR